MPSRALASLLLAAFLSACSSAAGDTNAAGPTPSGPDSESEALPESGVCGASDLGREPSETVQVVDLVDLDGDGADDRVTMHRDGLLLACLADGRVMGALASSWDNARRGAFAQTLERVDLGGTDGVSVTVATDDLAAASGDRSRPDVVFLLRVVDGELGIVGDPNVSTSLPPRPLRHVRDGQDFFTGSTGPPAWSSETYTAFGCRTSPGEDIDFEVAQLVLSSSGLDLDLPTGVDGLTIVTPELPPPDLPEPPDNLAAMDLDQVLRHLGFTPRCLPEDAGGCREPGSTSDRVIDDVDLDDDGDDDRVTLHPDGVIQACLADGTVSAVVTWRPSKVRAEGARQVLHAADLGGIGGLVLTIGPPPHVKSHTQNYLLRLDQGELAVVGSARDERRPVHAPHAGYDFPTGADVHQGTEGSFGAMGCRPSAANADFDVITVIRRVNGRLHAEIRSVTGVATADLRHRVQGLMPDLPERAPRAHLDWVLEDAGFTPGCRPVQAAEGFARSGPTSSRSRTAVARAVA